MRAAGYLLMVALLSLWLVICTTSADRRYRRAIEPKMESTCFSTSYVYSLLTNLTRGTSCSPVYLLKNLTYINYFQYTSKYLVSSSYRNEFRAFCSDACYATTSVFLLLCFPSRTSKELLAFLSGMCAVDGSNQPCYEVVPYLATPSVCYGTISNEGVGGQCSRGCTLALKQFRLEAGCCARSVYDIGFTESFFYMDQDLWSECRVEMPQTACFSPPTPSGFSRVDPAINIIFAAAIIFFVIRVF